MPEANALTDLEPKTNRILPPPGNINPISKTDFRIQIVNPERLQEMLNIKEDFEAQAKALFLNTVFEIHKYLILISPLDTGELRGGWTGILKKYGQDFEKQIRDTSLYDIWKSENKTPKSKEYHFSDDAVQQGINKSTIEDIAFSIAVINNVEYGEYLESGTSKIPARNTTELARYKGEYWFNKQFNDWYEKIAKEGKIVSPEKQTDKLWS